MVDSVFEVAFLGTSGSCAVNNGMRARYGTNTPCVAVLAGGHKLIFDAGTGICRLSRIQEFQNEQVHLFLSHYHSDHLEGLLFWNAPFDDKQKINVYGRTTELGSVRDTVTEYLRQPFYPVGMEVFRAEWIFHDIAEGEEITLDGDVRVSIINLSHPGGCLGYKVSSRGKSVCYLTDVELNNHKDDKGLLEFIRNADLLILDSFFNDGEFVKGWGHSTPSECAELAKRANAKRLALYHFNFALADAEIQALEKSAREVFVNSFASSDGHRITV